MKKTSLFVGIIAMLVALNCFGADYKFGYVSIDRIGDAYSKAKDYTKLLEDKQAAYTAELDKKQNEVKTLRDKIALLSDKEKETKASEFEGKYKELQSLAQQRQSDLRKEQGQRAMELSQDIKKTITEYAEKEGYTMIFDAAAVAYQPKGMDVTDKIIEMLNSTYKK
ncbi:MAG: OmpH family outer membrane protein [Candidatus Omnitrophica bacterium]|nr:OmpH family outer membrane protein [Candidatus Omnitrophota bacterium]